MVANALSRRYILLSTLDARLFGFDCLAMYSMHVKRQHLASFIGMMDFCLEKLSCVCLRVLCVNCLLEKFMGEV